MRDRGADGFAPRSTPLTLVSGAIAGDDLARVTAVAAAALGSPVAVAIPELGPPVVHPAGSIDAETVASLGGHAAVVVQSGSLTTAPGRREAIAIRIGERIVGVLSTEAPRDGAASGAERRAWLEATAAAASVAALIRQAEDGSRATGATELLRGLGSGPWEDTPAALARARRLGVELSTGATAVVGHAPAARSELPGLPATEGVLLGEVEPGRFLALVPPAATTTTDELTRVLRAHGLTVACSSPRRNPADLHDAVREAQVLVELAAGLDGDEASTYRLLIGVLLRDRAELEQLRDGTIAPLATYDARHDTELLNTLEAFLRHDGSTTETAEALALHRHTVGYRLSRVQEVSGLSPYESAGRERLSLGLKAREILRAADRRASLVN